jgi:hypothetical protein
MKGRLVYWAKSGKSTLKSLTLTVTSDEDSETQGLSSLSELRQRKILMLLEEAQNQGVKLSDRDLSLILLTSKATLKRDIRDIRRKKET